MFACLSAIKRAIILAHISTHWVNYAGDASVPDVDLEFSYGQ